MCVWGGGGHPARRLQGCTARAAGYGRSDCHVCGAARRRSAVLLPCGPLHAPLPATCPAAPRTPRGPTLTMRVHSYSLIRDVVAAQQRPRVPQVGMRVCVCVSVWGCGVGGCQPVPLHG